MISWECAVEVNQSTVSTFIMQVEGDRGEDWAGRTGEAENPASTQGFVVAAKSVQSRISQAQDERGPHTIQRGFGETGIF